MSKLLFLAAGLLLGLLLARFLRGRARRRGLMRAPRPLVRVGDERIDSEDIRDLIRRGRKIEAIKLVRERTGLGLAEAKDAVEALEHKLR